MQVLASRRGGNGAARRDSIIATVEVLVIEDEKKIASLIRKGLEAHGLVVDVCLRGDEGYALAIARPCAG
jgi:hypothetical protein